MMNTSNQEDNLAELYEKYLKITDVMVADYDSMAVAGVMLAIAFGIYRTTLTEEDYQKMMVSVFDKRNEVKSFR